MAFVPVSLEAMVRLHAQATRGEFSAGSLAKYNLEMTLPSESSWCPDWDQADVEDVAEAASSMSSDGSGDCEQDTSHVTFSR